MDRAAEPPKKVVEMGSADTNGVEMSSRAPSVVADVAACTTQAAHRRDHHHRAGDGGCHPHAIEVVHLGRQGLMICHDCGSDSGFVPEREAERLADGHRHETAA